MSEVMSHQQWMQLTNGGYLSVRSQQLKAVDDALAKYGRTKSAVEKEVLTGALLKWMQAKGPAWKQSVRNKHRAIEILYSQIAGISNAHLTGREKVALSHLRDESRAIVHDLFFDKRLIWRQAFTAKLANNKWGVRMNVTGAARNGKVLAPAGQSAAGNSSRAGQLAQDLVQSVVPPEILPEVLAQMTQVIPDFIKELAASITPFVGVIASGGAAVWNTKNALRGQWRIEWAQYHVTNSLSAHEPAAAFQALIRHLERERNQDSLAASLSVGEFCGKLAGVLADGGTATNAAIGLATNIAKLLSILRVVVRDVLEKRAANRQMQTRVDASVFDTCPVVGAYLICCAPTSVMVNTILDQRFGEIGWQNEVENAVRKHLQPLREHARRVVQEHRFWIPELYHHPGIMEKNKKKLKVMLANKGKTGMEGFGHDDALAALMD